MNGHGQWPPPPQQQPPMQHYPPQHQQYQPSGMPLPPGGPGIAAAAAAAAGGRVEADVLPTSEELEAEAVRRGMPPLDTCLRRCPRCLQGVPIRR